MRNAKFERLQCFMVNSLHCGKGVQGKKKKPYVNRTLMLKINEPTADYCINCRFSYGAASDVKSEPKAEFSISSKVIVSVPSL